MSVNETTESALDPTETARRVVAALMGATGMKAVDLARELHMSKQRLSERLNGPARFTWAEIVDLADLFDVPTDTFRRDPTELLRSRCFSRAATRLALVEPVGQLELDLDDGDDGHAAERTRPRLELIKGGR